MPFSLWAFYDAGEGVERNAEEAQKWLLLAAEQGHEKAIELLEEENDKLIQAYAWFYITHSIRLFSILNASLKDA